MHAMQMGFDGETSSLALRSAATAELPPRGEPLQKYLSKLHLMGDAEAACTAGGALLGCQLSSLLPARKSIPQRLLACLCCLDMFSDT